MKTIVVFLIFAQNIDVGTIRTASLRRFERVHDLCFRANIRKTMYTPVYYYTKVGCKGVLITRKFYPDVLISVQNLPHHITPFYCGNTLALNLAV